MNAVMYEQTAAHLTRQVRYWDRRLRTTTSVIWGPRGIILGLVIGVVIAAISRTRAWLFPEQIVWITAAAIAVGLSIALAAIWLWPRSTTYQARYFDRQFGLKERVSTAMEITAGMIPLPAELAEHQLEDAVRSADRVNASLRLPLRVKATEILALVLLAAILALLLLAHNRYAQELKTRQQLQQAINNQAAALQQTAEQIQNDGSLTPAEKDALTQPLDEAREILQQPDVSQQEAVAALAEASQKLNDMQNGMTPDQQQAYQDAANELTDSAMTNDLGQALKQGDLGQTADELNNLSDDLKDSNLSEAQQQDLAEQLDNAAEKLNEANPALAQKLREAADALRQGDTQAAEKALNEAADLAREQQKQLENSAMSEAARQAQEQMEQSQKELAEAGREQSQEQAQAQSGEQQSQQQSQQSQSQQSGEQSQSQQAEGQQQSQGQPQTSEQASSGQQAAGEQSQGDQAASGAAQQGDQAGQGQEAQAQTDNAGAGNQSASSGQEASQGTGGESASEGEQSSSQEAGSGQSASAQGATTGQSQSPDGQAALGAGEGQGGAGNNTTTGAMAEAGGGEISTGNSPDESGLQDYNPVYDPSTIGGQSEDVINVGGQSTNPDGTPLEQGEFGDNPAGESTLSYSSVFGNYQDIVSEALDSGRIPLDQRDVIHDYFASIAR